MSDLLEIKEQTVGEQLVGEQCASKLLVNLKQVYGRSVRIGGNLLEKHETVTNMRSKLEFAKGNFLPRETRENASCFFGA